MSEGEEYRLPENPAYCAGTFNAAICDYSRRNPGKSIALLTRNGIIAGFALATIRGGVETVKPLSLSDFINICHSVGTWYYCYWTYDKDGAKVKEIREGIPAGYVEALLEAEAEDMGGVREYPIDEESTIVDRKDEKTSIEEKLAMVDEESDNEPFLFVVAFVLGILAVGAVYVAYQLAKKRYVEVELLNG